ncbi:MAG: discoidin domain-containing protein [Spirochaetales bacterium]|nr:discoidin domain-containing protein [Spirochaetales bacterium]
MKYLLCLFIVCILFSCTIPQGDSVSYNGGPPIIQKKSVPAAETLPGGDWRSSLYPDSWTPGFAVDEKFLHDFSYAGYRLGDYVLPGSSAGPTIDVTLPPYNADNSGTLNATTAIQKAINDVGRSGGGIVYLPAGTYAIKPPASGDNGVALKISYSNVILRGAGTGQTFLLNTATYMRLGSVIRIQPNITATSNFWDNLKTGETTITMEYSVPTMNVQVTSAAGFSVGDWIVIALKNNSAMIDDLDMESFNWGVENPKGPRFFRKITGIAGNVISFDIPTRFPVLAKYSPTVYKLTESPLTDVGIESFSIGNVQNPKSGDGDEDYNTLGTMAYEVHGSHAIDFKFTVNSWVKNIDTFKPAANSGDFHVLSNMMLLYQTRGVTVYECTFQKPQYEGGGGNGYMYTLAGNDNLITNCEAIHSRHNYDFKYMYSNGNVITQCVSTTPRLVSDFHMFLSMANLFDKMTVNADAISAVWRPYGTTIHGQVTSESVIWNTTGNSYMSGKSYIVQTQQWGNGYVIGTQGSAAGVELHADSAGEVTLPIDHLEGEGSAATLFPESLYESMYIRRRNREAYSNTDYPQIYSVSSYQAGREPEFILDNNSGDEYRWSASPMPQWVILDYGETTTFTGTNVYTYLSRAYQYIIEVSDSPTSGYTTIVDRSLNVEVTQPITDAFSPAAGRYLRLTVLDAAVYDGDWASITEFGAITQ